jgi:hypothetical protein
MAAVHAKESELLDYIEKMTAKCTQLQSTLSVIHAQVCIKYFNEQKLNMNKHLKKIVNM